MRVKHVLVSILIMISIGVVGSTLAAPVDPTPSTNDQNRINGWAHVNQISIGPGTTDMMFISTRAFQSCFEYRTDGDLSQSTGDNYNPAILDGLYPFTCENNSSTTLTIEAEEYVEIRMVFGGESDERFDWTRFEVDPVSSSAIPANASWAMWALIVALMAISSVYLSRRSRQGR